MEPVQWRIYPDPDDEKGIFYQEKTKHPTRYEVLVGGRVLGFLEQAYGEESFYVGEAPPTDEEIARDELQRSTLDTSASEPPVSERQAGPRLRDLKKAKVELISRIKIEQTDRFKQTRQRYQNDMIALDELEELVHHPERA